MGVIVLVIFEVFFFLLVVRSSGFSLQQQQQQQESSSLLTSTAEVWKLRLDIGLQPGTWMPKRYPGWAESGGRLGFDIEVKFTDRPCQIGPFEKLVGPENETYEVVVSTSSPSKFVSERGEQTVDFTNVGGWCITRNSHVLRFWLDCTSGAKRRDVEIFPNTRLFFTTSVWDDPDTVLRQQVEYRTVLEQLEALENQNILKNLWSIRELTDNSREADLLKVLKQRYERELLPPKGALVATNGVQMAPTGPLVIKGNETPWYVPGSEYLILGTFSTAIVDDGDDGCDK